MAGLWPSKEVLIVTPERLVMDSTSLFVTAVTWVELLALFDEKLGIAEIPTACNPWIREALMVVARNEIFKEPELTGLLLDGVVCGRGRDIVLLPRAFEAGTSMASDSTAAS